MADLDQAVTIKRPERDRVWTELWRQNWPFLAILAFILAIRVPTFGNPVLDFDEQLYLLIGDRMLHGQLPYVDLWDRKPVGLFAIYALIRLLLGGEGFVQYQSVAAACVFGTAGLIFSICRRSSGHAGGLIAACAYVALLNPLHGAGGQSCVIYNLFTATAAWALFKASEEHDRSRSRRLGLLAMAMAGLAIQCKYTPAIEGCYFGLAFLWLFRRSGMSAARMLLTASAMVIVAMAPTIVVFAWYWHMGHLDALLQANLWSTLARKPFPPETRADQRFFILLIASPLIVIAIGRILDGFRGRFSGSRGDFWLATGWLAAAVIGFAMLGDFYDFYFITVLPPLLILAAPLLEKTRATLVVSAVLLIAYPLLLAPPSFAVTAERRNDTMRLVSAIEPYLRNGRCLYVYDGPASLYYLTHACAPTRFIYPDHLNNPTELPALGVDARAEEARLLGTHPGAIVIANRPVVPRVDPGTRAILLTALKRDYVRVARVKMRGDRTYDVFALRSLNPPQGVLSEAPINPE